MRRFIPLAVAALSLHAVACSGRMGRVVHHYEEARLPEAVAGFRAMEAEARDFDDADRARYALYRGLSHLGVGDLNAALLWLSKARAFDDRDPTLLSRADRARLASAWRSAGLMPGERITLR